MTFHYRLPKVFSNTSTERGLPPPPLVFAINPLILMILLQDDSFKPLLFIDTKNVPVAFHLTSRYRPIFQIFAKNPGKMIFFFSNYNGK